MADATEIGESSSLFPTVPLIQKGWKVVGGDEASNANLQAAALTHRTAYLKAQLDELVLQGVTVVGTLVDMSVLSTIDTAKLPNGTGYFIQGALVLWNGHTWISSGSLIPEVNLIEEISEDADNDLRLGSDNKLYVSTKLDVDVVEIYTTAKE